MKVAILHNFLDNIGGAEKFCLKVAAELEADIYTTNVDEEKVAKMGFDAGNVKSIGWVPVNAPFRQQMTQLRFARLDLGSEYDLYIITGDWAVSSAVNNKPNIWYVHHPTRELYDLYGYTRENVVSKLLRPVFDLWVRYNRRLNRGNIGHVEKIACNSKNTRERVKRYLGRDSEVIYPPIKMKRFRCEGCGDYWLSVNRLIGHKRVDVQLKAFEKMPDLKLVVVGSFERSRQFRKYADYIDRIKPANVELKSFISEEELLDLYANCRGLICTSLDEDMGIAPIEANASGKPVIAPDEGGYRETVVDGVTGLLMEGLSVAGLVKAVRSLDADPERFRGDCVRHARKYDMDLFIGRLSHAVGADLV